VQSEPGRIMRLDHKGSDTFTSETWRIGKRMSKR
jgi:hypothetical protein